MLGLVASRTCFSGARSGGAELFGFGAQGQRGWAYVWNLRGGFGPLFGWYVTETKKERTSWLPFFLGFDSGEPFRKPSDFRKWTCFYFEKYPIVLHPQRVTGQLTP